MPKKKHWFFTVKGKGGCPPAFATGVDGDLTITGTSWVNLSSIPKASAGLVWQFDNLQIEEFAWLAIDVGTGTELVQIICKTSCDLIGSIVTTGGPVPSSSYNGWENNGSSISGTTVSGYSYSASIVQNSGGAGYSGWAAGGAGTNGYGGGGSGGGDFASGGTGGSNNGPGATSFAPGGAGDSTQAQGGTGGNGDVAEGASPIPAPGGSGGGSGGGGGYAFPHGHPATTGKFPTPFTTLWHNGAGGGGGGQKGGHGGYLFIYFCETITSTKGRLFAFGDTGYDGGAAGTGYLSNAGGGGGGAGGSGGHIWLECAAHSQAVTVAGGAGGSGGSPSGGSGATGNAGTFTHIPT